MANIRQRLLASSILVAGLGLYSPLYEQIYKSSVRSLREHFAPASAKSVEYKSKRPCRKVALPRTSSQIGMAISPDGTKVYQITNKGIKVFNKKTGKQKRFDLPKKFPQLSWGTDIAYDSKRDLVSLVSLGGEGYLYRFDVNKRRWFDVRSLDNLDIKSIAYDRMLDRYVAWVEDYGLNQGNLLFIAGTGELLYQEKISDRMIGFERLHDRYSGMSPAVEIIARGNNITLITHDDNSVQSIWYYDRNSNTVRSTYRTKYSSKFYSD